MAKPLTDKIRGEIYRVMQEKCDTSEFGVRDAYTFASCIPGINQNVKEIKDKFIDQPLQVKAVFYRCKNAEEAVLNDRDYRTQGARRGFGIEHPITHKEVLVKESMEKTAKVVQSDKAGVCHTLAQFAFVNLMKECKLDGKAYDDVEPALIPSIRIVAHNPSDEVVDIKLRSASTHNFVIVGFDSYKELTYDNLERMKDEILIVDPWYFALGNKGEKSYGVYKWAEYPKGFLHNLSSIYDNQIPFTQAILESSRELAELIADENHKLKAEFQMQKQINTLQISVNRMKAKMSDLQSELSSLDKLYDDDEWGLEEAVMSDEMKKNKKESISQELVKYKKQIDAIQTQLDDLLQPAESEPISRMRV